MIRFLWTTQAIHQLRELAASGLTSQQISDLMGPSRGAIIGKLQREKIPLLGQRLFGIGTGSGQRPATPTAVLPVEERSGVAEAMVALKPSHCRWPLGSVEDPDFHYCSARRTSMTRPYCAKHEQAASSTWTARHTSGLTPTSRWVS